MENDNQIYIAQWKNWKVINFYGPISHHKTNDGAISAMKKHKEKIINGFECKSKEELHEKLEGKYWRVIKTDLFI